MSEGMKAVDGCDSAICKRSGDSKKEIRVWYTPGRITTHKIKCPYCGTQLERRVEGETILKVTGELR